MSEPNEAEIEAAAQIISDGWTTVPLAKDPLTFYKDLARAVIEDFLATRTRARCEVWKRNVANMPTGAEQWPYRSRASD